MSVGSNLDPDSDDYEKFTFHVDDEDVDRSKNEDQDSTGLSNRDPHHPNKELWRGKW